MLFNPKRSRRFSYTRRSPESGEKRRVTFRHSSRNISSSNKYLIFLIALLIGVLYLIWSLGNIGR